jgi:hypothetical protein
MIRLPFYIDANGKIVTGDWHHRIVWKMRREIMAAEDEAIFKILDAIAAESSLDSGNNDI